MLDLRQLARDRQHRRRQPHQPPHEHGAHQHEPGRLQQRRENVHRERRIVAHRAGRKIEWDAAAGAAAFEDARELVWIGIGLLCLAMVGKGEVAQEELGKG